MEVIKYANGKNYAGFNADAVSQMSFEEFCERHDFWGADRGMSKEKREEDLRSIYDKAKDAAGPKKTRKMLGEG